MGGLVSGFRWVAVVVGAGLVFAGVSGTCGMAMLLSWMPWNKKSIKKTGPSGGACQT